MFRFAETQLASNPGARYRDWVCLAYTPETMSVEKARLEAHIVENITEVYESPGLLPFGDKCKFFVRSSTAAGLQQCASSGKLATRQAVPDSSFHGFARAVRAFVASPAFASSTMAQRGRQSNHSVYCDAVARQVLVVLPAQSEDAGSRLEFIQFCLVVSPPA